jgi:two-component system phosphate regulon sensor histidine kinase PhoR
VSLAWALAALGAVASIALAAAWLRAERRVRRLERKRRDDERRAAERGAAQDAEIARQRLVLGSMAEGVLVLDRARHVLASNDAALRLLDAPGPVLGRPLVEVSRSARLLDAVERALRGSGPQEEELEHAPPGAPERVLRLRVSAFPASGEPEGVVAVLRDETPLHRLERVRRDFAVGVSHEFRTPLTAIRGFAETLVAGDVPLEKQREFAGIILRHAERLERLVDDLLTLSELEARRRPVEPERVDVGALARELVAGLASRIEQKGLRVAVSAAGAGPAWADRRALEHVLSNLLDNAIKYTEAGGAIEIRVRDAGSRTEIEVCDTGIGISERDLPRIFERFYRADRSRARTPGAPGGAGLGLSIARHLTELCGGEIAAESEAGKGSTFRVRLPRAAT